MDLEKVLKDQELVKWRKAKNSRSTDAKDTEISADNPLETKYLIGERGKYHVQS